MLYVDSYCKHITLAAYRLSPLILCLQYNQFIHLSIKRPYPSPKYIFNQSERTKIGHRISRLHFNQSAFMIYSLPRFRLDHTLRWLSLVHLGGMGNNGFFLGRQAGCQLVLRNFCKRRG